MSAIVDFGLLDAIGHLPTIASLAAMFLHGPTRLHHWLHDARRGLLVEAGKATVSFGTAIIVLFVFYYGMQRAEYGNATGILKHATLETSLRIR